MFNTFLNDFSLKRQIRGSYVNKNTQTSFQNSVEVIRNIENTALQLPNISMKNVLKKNPDKCNFLSSIDKDLKIFIRNSCI